MIDIVEIKKTEHLTLEKWPPFDLRPVSYNIYIRYGDNRVLIAEIYDLLKRGAKLYCNSTNLQDCITTWELYKEFIMLVDDAFERCEIDAKSTVVLD